MVQEAPGEGADTVFSVVDYTLEPNVEALDLFFGAGPLNGEGNELNNTIRGNEFANTIKGGRGNDWLDGYFKVDTLAGGPGDDTFLVDDEDDVVQESANEGSDTVLARASHVLRDHVESLILMTGAGPIDGTGNDLDNYMVGNESFNSLLGAGGNDTINGGGGVDALFGGDGHDALDGGADADTMVGGAGDDSFVVNNTGDAVQEAFGEGNDKVVSSVTYTLPTKVESLVLKAGAGAIHGVGNAFDNVIAGNEAANTLRGEAGKDTISGGAGQDLLVGGPGRDLLAGNQWSKTSDGVTDVFRYGGPNEDDTIMGFDARPPQRRRPGGPEPFLPYPELPRLAIRHDHFPRRLLVHHFGERRESVRVALPGDFGSQCRERQHTLLAAQLGVFRLPSL